MKRIVTALLLIVCIGIIGAADLESYEFIDRLLSLTGPSAPFIYEDAVVFTASSSWRRVGISFAHEGFSAVHWFRKLLIPRDPAEIAAESRAEGGPRNPDPNRDSGILFHVQLIPEGLADMDYRMIIDGLWTADPVNPEGAADSSGILRSRVSLPKVSGAAAVVNVSGVRFSFAAAPGEIITVGGSFNNWDPFMYEMRESGAGFYTLTLPLPPGTYQYVFFVRGERLPDPNNPDKVYTRDGKTASQTTIQ